MTRYKIGNSLRGFKIIEAESDKEAWEKGRKDFVENFPNIECLTLEKEKPIKIIGDTSSTIYEDHETVLPP